MKKTLKLKNKIQAMAKEFTNAKGSMFLGRGFSYPIALEGALKLKNYLIYMQKVIQLVK